ncbi:MAG: DUF469 family protein [Bacteroidales bacterium]|nr:DUF469 family protein [Bacteroidales bacterium]
MRKKLRKGEFVEFGFEIIVNFSESAKQTSFDEWLDKFIDEIENNNLAFGGGGDFNNFSGYIVTNKKNKKSATDDDRVIIQNWLNKQDNINDFIVKELTNSWK